MNEPAEEYPCRVIGVSVAGASHARHGQPSQDALHWQPDEAVGLPRTIAVADGHGSLASFRSALGSRLAVQAATETTYQFLQLFHESSASLIKRTAEERLPCEIVRLWTERVRAHLLEHPFRDEEMQTLENRGGPSALKKVHHNPLIAYGATILVVGVAKSFILYLQLGDGDILVVDADGEVSRPLPLDERLIADETTSLCLPEAWRDFRFSFQGISDQPPALISLSTDGYANCFASEVDYLKVGRDLLALIQSRGADQLQQDLPGYLQEATEKYSGDDITLGIIWFPPR